MEKIREHKPSALVVDPDLDLATLAAAILNDDGFIATILTDISIVAETVRRLEPDVVLIDIKGYADQAARDVVEWIGNRPSPIPVVMFSDSEQMRRTVGVTFGGKQFVDVVPKPFELPQLIDTLHKAVNERVMLPKVRHLKPPTSIGGLLRKRGVKDVQEAPEGEWVVFHDEGGVLVQIYWWANADAYCITRAKPDSAVLEDLGRTKTAEEAVERALSSK